MPGVGKTTLAIMLAYDERVRNHFTDGVLWAGLGPNPDVVSIQTAWADALGVDLREVPDVHKRQQRISAALSDRHVLAVIDDAWQLDAAQALQCSAPGVAHILTTRNASIATAFAGPAQSVKVPVLDDETAWELLQGLAPEACAVDPVSARKLVNAVGGLPLAIELLGGYLAAPERTLFTDMSQAALAEVGDPARRLALAQTRLGSVTGQLETLEAVIRLSSEDLAKVDSAAADAFFALGAFAPKPATFTRDAAEAVTDTAPNVLALLAARNLIEVGADESLAVHQVVHDAAAVHVSAEMVAQHRTYYLNWVDEDRGDWQRIAGLYPQIKYGWGGLSMTDIDGALAFVWTLGKFQEGQGLFLDKIAWSEKALALIQSNDRPGDAASMMVNLGFAWSALGEKQRALEYFNQALPLYRQVGDIGGEAITLNNIGGVFSAVGEKQKALEYYNQALPLYRQVGDIGGEASTLNNIGGVYDDLGDKQKALEYFNQALPLYRQVGDIGGEAITLNNIGGVFSAVGEKQRALEYYNQALPLRRQVGDIGGEASTLNNIGAVYDALGEKQRALEYFNQALPLRRQVGDIGGEASTLNNIGAVYDALGEKQRALEYFNQALPLLRQVGDRGGEASTLNNIGLVFSAVGEKQRALEYYNQALPLLRQVGDIGGEASTLNNIGAVYDALGEKQRTLEYFNQALPLLRQVGYMGGEAITLNNIGRVYDNLGEKQKALECYNQALPLLRQVGDQWGESVTRYNMAMLLADLGDLARAEEELQMVVAIDEATSHPDLESDRATLAQIQQRRKGQQPT